MAVIGDAYVVVHAITKGFEDEVRRAAKSIDLGKDGRGIGRGLSDGIKNGLGDGVTKSVSGLRREMIQARKAFQSMIRTSYTLGTAASILVSSLGTLVGGLVSLGSALVAAAPSAVVLGSALTSLGIAAIGLKGALAGVGAAISAGNKAQQGGAKSAKQTEAAERALLLVTERLTEAQARFNDVIRDAQEEVQQLGFDAEDAALSEKRAAIELEKAREGLARVQDLPPNSRARREAQLAFEEAELGLRRAKDKNADLRGEQERLAASAKKNGTEEYQQTQTYLDALKQLRDIARDQVDAQKELNDAKSGGGAGADAYANALAGLSEEAQGFVKYMVNTFNPSLKELRDALGEKLFGQLETGLEKLRTKLFPELKPVLKDLGDSIGKAFNTIIDAITKIENIGDLKTVIKNAGTNIESYARSFGSLYGSFLSLLVGSQKSTERFNKWLESKTAAWDKYLNTKQANGELEAFFDKVSDIAAQIGKIFGNVFSTLGNIVKANFTPGGGGYILLDWMEKATQKWEDFTGSVEGQKTLFDYFKGTAENFKSIAGAVGAYLKVLVKAGSDPNVGKFWDIIKGGAPYFEQIITAANKAGPSLAKLIVSIMKFVSVTMSSGAMSIFFDTLRMGFDFITKIMDNPGMQKFLGIAASIAAVVSAFGLFGSALSFFGKVLGGVVLKIVELPMLFRGGMTSIADIAAVFGRTVPAFLGITAAVAGVIAVFVLMYNKSEVFRKSIADLASAVGGALSDAFTTIKQAFTDVQPQIDGVMNVFKTLGDILGKTVVPIIKVVLVAAIKILANVIAGLIKAIAGIGSVFANIANPILSVINAILSGIKSVISGVKSVINELTGAWNRTLGKVKVTLPKILGFGGGTIGFPTLPQLAEGGVIPATPGGMLATIGEAGRPERVEPLDAQGLSVRDRAIIAELSGGKRGDTIIQMTVNPSPGMKETELAALVSRQIAFQLRRGGA